MDPLPSCCYHADPHTWQVSMPPQVRVRNVHWKTGPGRAVAACITAVAMTVWPGSYSHASERGPIAWVPVDASRLAGTRGGFIGASGLEVSLGIERLVSVNGVVVSRTGAAIADIGKLSAAQAYEARQALSAISLVRNGADNIGPAAHLAVPGATLVQNSLNGQHIGSHTVINSSVNTLGLLTSLNFRGSLGDAIARSARAF